MHANHAMQPATSATVLIPATALAVKQADISTNRSALPRVLQDSMVTVSRTYANVNLN